MHRAVRDGASTLRAIACALAVTALACGPATGTEAPPGSSAAVVQIANYAFTPQHITVAPGSAVLFQNWDGFDHAIATEAVAGSYVTGAPEGVSSFDSPPFTASWTVTVPAATPPGTVIPCFCWLHAAACGEVLIEVTAP